MNIYILFWKININSSKRCKTKTYFLVWINISIFKATWKKKLWGSSLRVSHWVPFSHCWFNFGYLFTPLVWFHVGGTFENLSDMPLPIFILSRPSPGSEYKINASEIHRKLVKSSEKISYCLFCAPNISTWVYKMKWHIWYAI